MTVALNTPVGTRFERLGAIVAVLVIAAVVVVGTFHVFGSTGDGGYGALVDHANAALTKWVDAPVGSRPPAKVPLAAVTGVDTKIFHMSALYGMSWDAVTSGRAYSQVIADLKQYPYQTAATRQVFEDKMDTDIAAAVNDSAIVRADLKSPSVPH